MPVYTDKADNREEPKPLPWNKRYDAEVYGDGSWTLFHDVNRLVARGKSKNKFMRFIAITRAVRRDMRKHSA
jgi:hypothetical protein